MNRFFISGCQRSGTTLLRLVLETHANIHCFDEQLGYLILIGEVRGEQVDYTTTAGTELIGFKIPRYAEQLLRDEFDDIDYGKCPSFYRGEPVIHMVRDPLDVIASMLTLKVPGRRTWIELYGRSILDHQFTYPAIRKRYGDYYRAVEDAGRPDHLVGALYWLVKNHGLMELLEEDKPVLPISYEAMVTNPEYFLRIICRFLQVPWSDELLYHDRYQHCELDEKGMAIGNTNPKRSIDDRSVGRYKKVLDKEQVEEVENFTNTMIQQLEKVLAQ